MSRFLTRQALLLATTACAFGAPVMAQAPDPTEEVILVAIPEGATRLDVITMLADRLGRSVLDIEAHVTVVDGEELRARNVQNIADIVRYVPGTFVGQDVSANVFGGTPDIQIRGVSGSRVQIQVDGGRVPQRITDGTRDYLDMNFTREAELVRGPSSILWGSDALGGVLALRTVTADDLISAGQTSGGQVTASYADINDAANTSIAYAARLGDSASLLLGRSYGVDHEMTLSNARGDGGDWGCKRSVQYGAPDCGTFDPLERTSERTIIKAEFDLGNSDLAFSADLLDRLSVVDYRQSLGPAHNGNYTVEAPRIRDLSRTRYGVDYSTDALWGMRDISAVLAYTPTGYHQDAITRVRNAAGETVITNNQTDYSEDFLELDLRASKDFTTGGLTHALTFGLDADRTINRYDRLTTTQNVTTGSYTEGLPSGFHFTDGIVTRADLYIQDRITALGGALEIVPGLRYATHHMDPTPNGLAKEHENFPTEAVRDEALLMALAATYHIDDNHSVWGNYSQGFKVPSFQQMYTSWSSFGVNYVPAPWLKPESVENIELGLRGEYDNGFWAVNAFRADYDNFISSYWLVPQGPLNPTGEELYSSQNLAMVRTWGIEVEGAWQVNDDLRLNGSLAWMDGVSMAERGGEEKTYIVPPVTAVIGADYQFNDMLGLSARAKFAGDIDAPEGNFAPAGYALLDLGTRITLAENATLNINANNVFDTRYFEQGAANQALPSASYIGMPPEMMTGAGRNIAFNIDIRF